jgi:hypothetical protein
MLSDVCAEFLMDTRHDWKDGALVTPRKKITAVRMRKCAAKLEEEVRTWYDDGWYGVEPKTPTKIVGICVCVSMCGRFRRFHTMEMTGCNRK